MKNSIEVSQSDFAAKIETEQAVTHSATSLFNIVSFSHFIGFYFEGPAEDRGPARGQPSFRRVAFAGDKVERERLVFHELEKLSSGTLKALNALYFAGGSIDLPDLAAPSPKRPLRLRKIALQKRVR